MGSTGFLLLQFKFQVYNTKTKKMEPLLNIMTAAEAKEVGQHFCVIKAILYSKSNDKSKIAEILTS